MVFGATRLVVADAVPPLAVAEAVRERFWESQMR